MTGKTHQVIGVTVALGSYLILREPTYGPATLLGVLVAAHFGSLWPDIDNATADIYDSLPMVKPVSGVTSAVVLGHRNFTHSLLGLFSFSWLMWFLLASAPPYWGLEIGWIAFAFFVGYLCHIVADMVTVEGLPLFWPWQRMFGIPPKPFEGVRIQTGKWFENLVLFPLINLLLIGLLYVAWPAIHSNLFR